MNPTEVEQFKKKYNYKYSMYSLDKEEVEAETIYKLALLNLIDKELFIYMAKSLYSRSKLAGHYLEFLIINKAKLISF